MKHVFIINPAAGKKDNRQRVYAMADALRDRHGLYVACMLTQSRGHAITLARGIAEAGESVRFYTCGGDGTAHEVANGIAGFDNAAMTVIPTGTGNDLLKNFGPGMLPKFSDAENLWDGEVQQLDLIDCNGKLCITIACSGIDARVAESVHDFSSSVSGKGAYLASVALNFVARPISQHWTLTLDDTVIEDDFALAAVCNGRYYGGGFTPVREARMNDGQLRTVVVRGIGRLKFVQLFNKYGTGRYKDLPPELIRAYNASLVRIQGDDIVTCLDGECSHSQDVTLRLSDKKLNFFGPKGCNPNATAL